MNLDVESEAPPDDHRHGNNFDAYAEAEGFYIEDEGEENEDEAGGEYIERAGDDKDFYSMQSKSFLKSSLLDIVFVGKEQEEEEEEEEEEVTRDFQSDIFSPVKNDQTIFRYTALSDEERREIIQKVKELFSETKVLMVVNKFLHKNYIDINRKSPSMANALDKFDEAVIFEDTRYQATLENFAQIRGVVDERISCLTSELEHLESCCDVAETAYTETFENLLSQQLALARKTKPPKCAKEIWLAEVEQYLENQRQRATEVAKIRLAHVHSQSKLAKLMTRLKQFDSLGPGFSMMDFEYLLKRKDVYSERRDEQRESINNLKGKNLTSAAIIRHVDEETDLYNEKVMKNLDNLAALVSGYKRERSKAVDLAKSKVLISKSTDRLKEEIGLLNYPFLLRKMERDLHQTAKLKKRSDYLQAKMLEDAKKIAECHR